MSPRRIAGEGKSKDSTTPLDAMLRPHANQSEEKPFAIWGPITVWASSPDEALERAHDLLSKPRPEFRGYRASFVCQRISEEPVSAEGIKKQRSPRARPEEIARRLKESERARQERENPPPAA